MSPCRIKICGLRDVDTAVKAAELGADAIGLVFYPPSPRNVDVAIARDIAKSLPPFVTVVGLFVDAGYQQVQDVLDEVGLDLLQFHGNETPKECERHDHPYIKAIRVKPGINLVEYATSFASARGLLCDAYSASAPGGTGESFDWGLIPPVLNLPVILSGGLSKENVASAIKTVRPWAVDVSSGVEHKRGVKDLALVEQFVRAVRTA